MLWPQSDAWYPGEDRGVSQTDLSPEQIGVSLVEGDEFLQLFAVVAEGHDALAAWTVDPEQAFLGLHLIGDVREPVPILAQVGRDAER